MKQAKIRITYLDENVFLPQLIEILLPTRKLQKSFVYFGLAAFFWIHTPWFLLRSWNFSYFMAEVDKEWI